MRCSRSSARRPNGSRRDLSDDGIVEIKLLQEHLHDAIGQLVYDRTRRRPMILPVVIEVMSVSDAAGWSGRSRASMPRASRPRGG